LALEWAASKIFLTLLQPALLPSLPFSIREMNVKILFLSCSCFDLFEIFGKSRLVGKIIDPAAQPADMTVVAHDQMLSDPAQ
jgi:hypothetical protein